MTKNAPHTFPKSARLCKSHQFKRVNYKYRRLVGKWIIIDSSPQKCPGPIRLGITVTKKFGSAVQRNRFKRITREAFRICRNALPLGLDIIAKPRTEASSARSTDIQQEMMELLLS